MFRGTLFTIVSSGDVTALNQLVARQPRLDLKMKMGEQGQSKSPRHARVFLDENRFLLVYYYRFFLSIVIYNIFQLSFMLLPNSATQNSLQRCRKYRVSV
jgi:hypothetical protein